MGPFTLLLLAEHLSTYHLDDHPETNHFYDTMKIISPEILGGRVLFYVGRKQQEGKDVCPLKSLGCGFRLSVRHLVRHSVLRTMCDHVDTHELIDRVRCIERIRSYGLIFPFLRGLVTCPICSVWQQKHGQSFIEFLEHIEWSHSRIDRHRHAETLFRVFAPLLLYQEHLFGWLWTKPLLRISMELQDAGMVLPVRLIKSASGIQVEKSIEESESTT
jgi:hypothetical protein